MSEENQNCPKCQSPHGYKEINIWICPECFNEWSLQESCQESPHESPHLSAAKKEEASSFLDANGVPLQNGDTVAIIKDLKIGKETIGSGTKAKNIRLLDEPVDGHDISCKIPEYGSIYLKCSVVKKVK